MNEKNAAGTDYDIFIREGDVGMYWRHSDRGLWIGDEGMRWTIEGRERTEKLSEIESIHLMSAYVHKSGNVFTCQIRFKWGQPLNLYSTNDWGSPDEERELPYRYAVLDLHQRLAKSDNKNVVYRAGMTSGRHRFLLAATIAATLLFGALPLGIFLFLETSFHVFGVTAAGIAFIWPLWTQWHNNEPRTYFPDDLPYDLIPGQRRPAKNAGSRINDLETRMRDSTFMRERTHFSARQNIAVAALSCGIGAYCILAGLGFVPAPTRTQSLSGPLWVVLLSGSAFILGGLIVLSRGFAGDGKFEGPLPEQAPFWLRLAQYLAVLLVFAIFGAIGSWIAFGPGTRPFHLSTPWFFTDSFSEQFGRLAFGAGALLTWACTIAIALTGARKLFGKQTIKS